jgi:hypothetical protein
VIGSWIAQTPALLVALAVVFAPGLLIGAGLRLRGLTLFAVSPVISTGVIAALAVVYDKVRIPWTLLSVGIGCAVIVALAWIGGHFLGRHRHTPAHQPRYRWILGAGLAIGIAFCALRFIVYVHDPAAISQTNDAVFHLNAIRYILETQDASSLHISGVVDGSTFYPAAWHALTSLVALAGAGIPVAANMVSLVIAAVIWPLGLTWFTSQIVRGALGPTAIAASMAAALHVFPMLMFQWGVVYSYALSVALLPAAAGLLIAAPRWIRSEGPVSGTARSAVLLTLLVGTSVVALALAQPATLLAWAILGASGFIWWVGMHVRSGSPAHRRRLIWALCIVGVAFIVVWIGLTLATTGSHWPPFRGKLIVVLDVLLNRYVLLPAAPAISILMIIGLVVAIRRPSLRWLATAWAIFMTLYIVSASIGAPILRRGLIGAWYADPYRMAALAPVTVLPLAAIGLATVAVWATHAISGRTGRPAEAFATAWSLVAVTLLGILSFAIAPMIQMPAITQGTVDAESRYVTKDYLSPDERALLERLPGFVPAGTRVLGNPSTGSGFGYMLSGRDVFPRTWSPPHNPAWSTIAARLHDAGTDPAVCDALKAYGYPGYVLDFGAGEDSPGRFVLPGMTDFAGRPGFELVAAQGDASLWRITACTP